MAKVGKKIFIEQQKPKKRFSILKYIGITAGALAAITVMLPTVLMITIEHEQEVAYDQPIPFPITVDPLRKIIAERPEVNDLLESSSSPLQASAINSGFSFSSIFTYIATTIADANWYQGLASVVGVKNKIVYIGEGYRREQVVAAFSKALNWNEAQKQQFLTPLASSTLPFTEGSFAPGTYVVNPRMTPVMVQELVNKKFTDDVVEHYSTSTAALVPLKQALTIASIVQRETIGNDDARLIAGILWNRIFINMPLQVDATLQYAKANTEASKVWWPQVEPKDKYIKSPYNTYANPGLPPTPIANPSVAAILATLNPLETSCIYYFNDKKGNFHCSETYKEHVSLIKKYYPK